MRLPYRTHIQYAYLCIHQEPMSLWRDEWRLHSNQHFIGTCRQFSKHAAKSGLCREMAARRGAPDKISSHRANMMSPIESYPIRRIDRIFTRDFVLKMVIAKVVEPMKPNTAATATVTINDSLEPLCTLNVLDNEKPQECRCVRALLSLPLLDALVPWRVPGHRSSCGGSQHRQAPMHHPNAACISCMVEK